MEAQARPIGVFDSGLGGISVLRACVRLLPQENFLFFGDSANAPYGEKSLDQVRALTLSAVDRLLEQGVKGIVVACNTATSVSAGKLRQELDQINRQLKEAYERFNYACEPELVEASIYEINALKAKYDYLLRCVKERSGMPVNRRAAVPAAQEACVAASAVKGGKPCRS